MRIFKRDKIFAWRRRYKRSNVYTILKKFTFVFSLKLIMSAFWIDASSQYSNKIVLTDLFKGINYGIYVSQSGKRVSVEARDTIPSKEKSLKRTRRLAVNLEKRLSLVSTIKTHLPLTEHGIINLKKYPVEALEFCISKIQWALQREDPYISLLFLCEKHCRENNLPVERAMYHKEKNLKGIKPDDQIFYQKELFVRKEVEKPVLTKQSIAWQPIPLPSEEELERTRQEVLAIDSTNIFMQLVQAGFSSNTRKQIV